MLKISFDHRNKLHLKYIQIETVIQNCNNISQYYCLCYIFDQLNVALLRIRDVFSKMKKLSDSKLLNGYVSAHIVIQYIMQYVLIWQPLL